MVGRPAGKGMKEEIILAVKNGKNNLDLLENHFTQIEWKFKGKLRNQIRGRLSQLVKQGKLIRTAKDPYEMASYAVFGVQVEHSREIIN